ncbi:MAG: hypothetical protein U0R70_11150 [Solirubrobacteraceae bacterium]
MVELAKDGISREGASAAERIRIALHDLGPATLSDLSALADVRPQYAASVVSRLVKAGQARRLGRGVVAAGSHSAALDVSVRLSGPARELQRRLGDAEANAAISGMDVMAPLGSQLGGQWPHLIYVDRGAGDWAADLLRPSGFRALVGPTPAQLQSAAELGQEFVLIRERSLTHPGVRVKPFEEAWVDLLAEQKRGYPIATSELASMLEAMARLSSISWTKIIRAARRRSIQFDLAPHARIPLSPGDLTAAEVLQAAGGR